MHMLSTTMDMKRQIIETQHPMYDTKVSALASVDYDEKCMHIATMLLSSSHLPVLVDV